MRLPYACASILLAALSCSTVACGTRTPQYGIYFGNDGSGPAVNLQKVQPEHIDRAFAAAAQLLDVDAAHTAQQGFVLEFHQGAIAWETNLYAGATEETTSRVVWYPCAFQPQSAMVHEFVHGVLFATRGDSDAGHTHAAWQHVDAARAALQDLCD